MEEDYCEFKAFPGYRERYCPQTNQPTKTKHSTKQSATSKIKTKKSLKDTKYGGLTK